MQILRSRQVDEPSPCPYLPGRQRQFEYFWAMELSDGELGDLLEKGWRKFGPYYFRPNCPDCRACIPVRIAVADFSPSRSQKRVLRKNRDLQVSFGPLHFTDRVFEIYSRHAEDRFRQDSDLEDFLAGFYISSCPTMQIDIRLDGLLIGVGFLDRAESALSSVYFCFDPAFSRRNLGTFSILQEIERARRLGLSHHYLGYFVPGCRHMLYKDHFRPRDHLDWQSGAWKTVTDRPGSAAGAG
ncbi:MAG: arginyltransferase [Desulfuromonadales bacterium]|nr:arginyltransferase [Desulfuromonadales bacterium]NIS39579.1 arginyltransferase [Desulfuromonadales bacterium]